MDKVANSIKEFGYRVPIIIDKNNVIVAGHTRLLAAEKLGITEIPCIVADDLTEQQIKEKADEWKGRIDLRVYKAMYNWRVEIID